MEEKNLISDYEANFAVLVAYIDQYQKAGYNVYSDISEISKLIDFIANWYEVKYPDNVIDMSIECYKQEVGNGMYFHLAEPPYALRKTENLSEYMDYYQLMLRLPRSMHKVIECWYKGNMSARSSSHIMTSISLKESLVENVTHLLVSEIDGYLDLNSTQFLKTNCATIDELIDKNKYYNEEEFLNLDLSDPIKIVETHNIDLEIRNRIFNIIILKLFESSPDKNVGYIRAKLFINEFNKYIYNLNLDSKIIDEEMENKELYEEDAIYVLEYTKIKDLANYVIEDITEDNSNNNPVYEYGLTFDTLKLLISDDMHYIHNLLQINNHVTSMDMDIDGRYNSINERDKSILRIMRMEAVSNLSRKVTTESIVPKIVKDDKLEEPKQKRKTIFGRNKQK